MFKCIRQECRATAGFKGHSLDAGRNFLWAAAAHFGVRVLENSVRDVAENAGVVAAGGGVRPPVITSWLTHTYSMPLNFPLASEQGLRAPPRQPASWYKIPTRVDFPAPTRRHDHLLPSGKSTW